MWPLKSDGSHTVTSDVDVECTSSLNFVVRVGVNLRHWWREEVSHERTISYAERTYHFDLDWCAGVRPNVHTQPVVVRLIMCAVVGEDEGDIDGAVVGLEREVIWGMLAGALVLYAMGATGLF